jgi:hypothetical protein
MATPWQHHLPPPTPRALKPLSLYRKLLAKRLPIPARLRLEVNAERRIEALAPEDRAALEPAIRRNLAEQLAKLPDESPDNPKASA